MREDNSRIRSLCSKTAYEHRTDPSPAPTVLLPAIFAPTPKDLQARAGIFHGTDQQRPHAQGVHEWCALLCRMVRRSWPDRLGAADPCRRIHQGALARIYATHGEAAFSGVAHVSQSSGRLGARAEHSERFLIAHHEALRPARGGDLAG
jgi:hypothetical protein